MLTGDIRLLGDRLIVRFDPPRVFEGSVTLPEKVDDRDPHRGEVLAVGPGRRTKKGDHIPMEVKVGDWILAAPQHMISKQGRILSSTVFNDSRVVIITEQDVFVLLED